MTDQLDTLLHEQRRFPPPPEFAAKALAGHDLVVAGEDAEAFWAAQARDLDWIRPWDRVLEWAPPHARWFGGS